MWKGGGGLGRACGWSPGPRVEPNTSRGFQLPSQWPPVSGGARSDSPPVIAAPWARAPSCGAGPRAGRVRRQGGVGVRSAPGDGAGVRQVRAQPDGPCAPSAARLHPTSRGEDAEGGLSLKHPLRAKRKAGSALSC